MGQYGISIKLWSSQYQASTNEFKVENSVAYMFQDRAHEDMMYISTIVKHLVGDDSLDTIIKENIPQTQNIVKGEPQSLEPLVKVEQEYSSGEENDDVKKLACDPDGQGESDDFPGESCDDCGAVFMLREKLVAHLESCFPQQIPRLEPKSEVSSRRNVVQERCEVCHKEFSQQSSMINHLKICNPAQISSLGLKYKQAQRVADILNQAGLGSSTTNMMSCSFCSRQFSMKKCLEKHELLHQTDPDSPKLMVSKKKKKSVGGSMPKGNYQCDKCSCTFRVYSALERHIEAHLLSASVPNPVTHAQEISGLQTSDLKDGAIMRCTKCDLAYNTYGMYRLHMQQYHEKSLNCEECGKKFTLPNTLKKHRLNYHTSFPKTCDACGQFCATKEEFKAHLASVHGEGVRENTVPCEICGKMVKNKYILKQHVKLVHEKKGGEFPCDQCGKVMKSKASLEYHSKVHTGEYAFRCDECGNGYMRFDQMLDCKNTHAGIFKFNCTHCDYKTNKTKAFKNHITIHSSEKPFICPLCNHPSNTTTNLNNHIKKVHKITLCQAEMIAKKNRFGENMTEEDLEVNRIKLERVEKVLDTMKLRPEYANINHQRPKEENMVQHGKRRPREPHPPPPVSREAMMEHSTSQSQDSESNSYGVPPGPPRPPIFFPYFGY